MTGNPPESIDPRIERLLGSLRWRIRAYVLMEGAALAIAWIGLTFWAALAIDYLPILVGATEMPRGMRAALLAIIAAGLAYILYRWVLRRTFVRLHNRSMALLLERTFERFHDSLMTSVELKERPDHATDFNAEMLRNADDQALEAIRNVPVGQVFNTGPLLWKLGAAMLLALTIVLFGVFQFDALAIAGERIYGLSNVPWPRSSQIEVVGLEVIRAPMEDGQVPPPQPLPLVGKRAKVARGASVQLRVRANADAPSLPDACTVYYRTADGERGRSTMKKQGRIHDGSFGGETHPVQDYVYDGKPFKGILSSISFDVVGRDHRVSGFQLDVVDSPTVVSATLDCEFPSYLLDTESGAWSARSVDYRSGLQLPLGTKFTLNAKANKALTKVEIHRPEADRTDTFELGEEGSREFAYSVEPLESSLTLDVTLFDVDGVVSERPQRLFVAAIPDEPPRVAVRLKGIGMAVTPDVVVPMLGKVEDDYGLARTWTTVTVDRGTASNEASGPSDTSTEGDAAADKDDTAGDKDAMSREFPIQLGAGGAIDSQIDFQKERNADEGIALQPGDKISVVVQAADKLDLAGGPNIGSGDKYQLDVVTPDALLSLLDQREYGLRMRYLQIIEEVTQMRDDLVRVKAEGLADDAAEPGDDSSEPGDDSSEPDSDSSEPGDGSAGSATEDLNAAAGADEDAAPEKLSPEERARRAAERRLSLRLLRTQRAQTQSEKSAQEVLGVAESFLEIREELVNNRVDTQDRKDRLKDLIADPLKLLVNNSFPILDEQLKELERKLADRAAGNAAADDSIETANNILLELEAVLEKMIDIQDFNEIVAEVRAMLESQEKLLEETKAQEKKSVLQDLFK